MDKAVFIEHIKEVVEEAVEESRVNRDGRVADYIPELANVDSDYVSACISLPDGDAITAGDSSDHEFTIQSVSKLILFMGLMEEFGQEKIFSLINAEPSGQPFASISHLDRYGPIPANPLINSGAIALCSHIPGSADEKVAWLDHWIEQLFGSKLHISADVYNSELSSADRNRALAYLMKSTGIIKNIDVEDVLKPYFRLCSYKATIKQASFLPMLLANGGVSSSGNRIISEETSDATVSIMATCGLYNESGIHLIRTGLPSKSAVSGLIVSVATGRGGIATFSPRLNQKGGSIRGHLIISKISNALGWHFAAPVGYGRDNKFASS